MLGSTQPGAPAVANVLSRFGGSARARARSPPPEPAVDSHPPRRSEAPAPRARQFSVQLSLWALVTVSATAGMLFYREHQRFTDDATEARPTALASGPLDFLSGSESVGADKASVADGAAAAGDDVATAAVVVADSAVAAAAPAGAVAAEGAARAEVVSAAAAVVALRAEVSSLKQELERHGKMLRYIMDRYVEKKLDGPKPESISGAAADTEEHQAAAVDLASPEFVSKSYQDASADVVAPETGGRSDLRRRKGNVGGDSVAVSGVV